MNKSYRAMLNRAFSAWIFVHESSSARRGSSSRAMGVGAGLLLVAPFAGAGAFFGSQNVHAIGVEQIAFINPRQPETAHHGDTAFTTASEAEQTPIKTRVLDATPGVAGHGAVDLWQSNGVLQDLNQRIDGVARDAYAGVAAAMAVQSPGAFLPGKTVVRVGTAMFKGESALGVSMRRTSENNGWSLTGGVGVSRAGVAVAVGAEWVFN